ncbi:MAG: hypothetical protein JW850_16145 [Thermoflexales bacterium]|nr:hypothetical protein [Thermoflexales bacterium]
MDMVFLHPNIPVIELDAHINDPEFADTAAGLLLDMVQTRPAAAPDLALPVLEGQAGRLISP